MRPDDPIVGRYLATSLVMRLATTSASGAASITPIWFVPVDGQLIASTAAATVAARNVAADPRVTVLLDGELAGRSDYVVRLRGRARVHEGLPSWAAMARIGRKYYLTPHGLRTELTHLTSWPLRNRYYRQSEAVWISIDPAAAELVRVPEP